MFDSPHYDYVLFDKQMAIDVFRYRPLETTGGCSSQNIDPQQDSIRDALHEGYRWVRSEGEFAVFEKVLAQSSWQLHPPSAPIHFISGVHHEN